METIESACCEMNSHGRLLTANKKFCRMFGFDPGEVEWHYIRDLFRYEKNWVSFIKNEAVQTAHFIVRLKNRKGRSFVASISRESEEDEKGRIIFKNTISKLSEINENEFATDDVQKLEDEKEDAEAFEVQKLAL